MRTGMAARMIFSNFMWVHTTRIGNLRGNNTIHEILNDVPGPRIFIHENRSIDNLFSGLRIDDSVDRVFRAIHRAEDWHQGCFSCGTCEGWLDFLLLSHRRSGRHGESLRTLGQIVYIPELWRVIRRVGGYRGGRGRGRRRASAAALISILMIQAY